MSRKNIVHLAVVVFSFACVLHLVRIIAGWNLVVGGVFIPVWASAIAVIVTGFLAYNIGRLK